MKALLQRNESDAKSAEEDSNFWCRTVATHYHERAELLAGTYAGTGDEHAVVVLLVDDKSLAEKAYALESRKSPKLVSAEGYIHRDAIVRYALRSKTVFYSSDR